MGFQLYFFTCFLCCFVSVSCSPEGQPIYASEDSTETISRRATDHMLPTNSAIDLPLINEEGELVNQTRSTNTAPDVRSSWILLLGTSSTAESSSRTEKVVPTSTSEVTWRTSETNYSLDFTDTLPTTDDGSGDWETETTRSPEETKPTVIPQSCFFTPCNSSHLRIHAKTVILAPEGSNITIACKVESDAETEVHWYRMNGTGFQFRNAAKNRSLLNLSFSQLQLTDSGLYTCAQRDAESCCRAEVRLKVYASPNYKRHLMIIGAVALVCFIVCASFSVWWNKNRLGKYAKQYKTVKKMKTTELLLA